MLSFIFECGTSTWGSSAPWALRIRVSMSEIGSVIKKLPTGFCNTGDKPIQGRLAESETRTGKLAHIGVAPAAHGAEVHDADRARVLRQLRQAGVVLLCF